MKKFILTIFSVALFCQLFIGQIASAQLLNNTSDLDSMTIETKNAANLGDVSLGAVVAKIIQIALGFLGVIFIILIIIAGFRWMTASGNEESIKKATATIKSAIIGLVIVLAAYTITYFIFNALPFAGGGAPQTTTGG